MPEENTQRMVEEFQLYQQQMQSLLIQKESLKLQDLEIDKALEELNAAQQKTAYKITGSIMVSKSVEDLKKELQETKETLDVQLKSMEKAEQKINDKLKELQEKLQALIK